MTYVDGRAIIEYGAIGGIRNGSGSKVLGENLSRDNLYITNPTQFDLGSNSNRRMIKLID